ATSAVSLHDDPPIVRFDTADGSVTISGDTAPCQSLVTLARDTDLLLHEAIDFDWVERAYGAGSPLHPVEVDRLMQQQVGVPCKGDQALAWGGVPGDGHRAVSGVEADDRRIVV